MEVSELKQKIESDTIPKVLVIYDNCHTLTNDYIHAISKKLNRRPMHVYSIEEAKALNGRFDRRDLLGIVHKDFIRYNELSGLDVYYIFIEETDEIPKDIVSFGVTFPKLNKNQCILYIENWLLENNFYSEAGEKGNKKKVYTLSRESIEKLINYFECDIDMIMGELNKLKCLEVHSLEKPFQALFECLPMKQDRLKSLPWYSGGAVDTAQVLYATYMKKLKAAGDMNVPIDKQLWYSQLITESIFTELNILSGTFGDYALEYFKLIEKMSPEEYKIQWFPPVSQQEIGDEWRN